MDDRILERLAKSGPLETLTASELALHRLPMTKDPQPAMVEAWVRFGGTPARVLAEACAWTERAVAIRFRVAGEEQRCWVWRSAVTALPPKPGEE